MDNIPIKLICRGCGIEYDYETDIYDLKRFAKNIGAIDYLACNWCPECEKQNIYECYREWPVFKRKPKQIKQKETLF